MINNKFINYLQIIEYIIILSERLGFAQNESYYITFKCQIDF